MKEIDVSALVSPTPGLIGAENYFQAAVLVPLIRIDGVYHLLFEKRASGIRQPGEVSFPGGAIEAEESITQAAVRETTEELGIAAEQIRVIGRFDSLAAPHGTLVHTVLAELTGVSLDAMQPNSAEVAEVFTVPVRYFLEHQPTQYQVRLEIHSHNVDGQETLFPAAELNLPSRYHASWGNTLVPVYVYQYHKRVIWGITGQIVRALTARLMQSDTVAAAIAESAR